MLRLVVESFSVLLHFCSHEGQSVVWPSFFFFLREVLCIPILIWSSPMPSIPQGLHGGWSLISVILFFEEAQEHYGPCPPGSCLSTLLQSWNISWRILHQAGCARRGTTGVLRVLQPSSPSWSCKYSQGSGWDMLDDNQRLKSSSPPCCFFLKGRDKKY